MRPRGLAWLGLVLACGGNPVPPAAPHAIGLSGVASFLDSVVADGVAPGAVLGVSAAGRRFFHGTGLLGQDDPRRPDETTIYDLASLTKVVGLTTAVMLAVDEGRLKLDQVVPAVLKDGTTQAITIRHLLTHSSGLPAWRPLYRETRTRAEAIQLAEATPLDTVPGSRYTYSDLGAIWLTDLVERAYGTRLDSLLEQRVFEPLGLRDTRYLPPAGLVSRIAPTENDPWRGRVLRGEVHDENAARLDGVSGHAGLFSSAKDLLTFGEWLLASRQIATNGAHPASPNLPPSILTKFLRVQQMPPGSSRALGWDTPSPGGSAGTLLSAQSFGHTGFTGTSIWIDPERQLVLVLLSNRVHPTRDNPRWGPIRAAVADRVVRALGDDAVTH